MNWCKKTWAKIILSLLIIIIGSFLLFVFLVYRQIQQVNSGDFSSIKFQENQLEANQLKDQYDLSIPNIKVQKVVEDPNSPMSGNSKAKVTVVEFADYQCGYCKQLHPIIRRLSAEYKEDVQFIYRDYPILGDESYVLALAGRCANDQGKFFAFHDKVFTNNVNQENILAMSETIGLNKDEMEECINSKKFDSQIQKDLVDGASAGARGTPTLFINGYLIPGAPSYQIFKRILDTTLENS